MGRAEALILICENSATDCSCKMRKREFPSKVFTFHQKKFSHFSLARIAFDRNKDDKIGSLMTSAGNITELLDNWRQGDASALHKLTPMIYGELRRIAHRYMQREAPNHTLQTTALVNEAYARLAKQDKPNWQDRRHFFIATAQVMRHILIDHARRRRYLKHGGELQRVPFEEAGQMSAERAADLVALDEALSELKELDARKHQVVELRYFGGLSLEETATALGVSEMTVRRDWRAAKAWLYRRVNG